MNETTTLLATIGLGVCIYRILGLIESASNFIKKKSTVYEISNLSDVELIDLTKVLRREVNERFKGK